MTTISSGNREARFMGQCSYCGRKRSLNPGIIHKWATKELGVDDAGKRNGGIQ